MSLQACQLSLTVSGFSLLKDIDLTIEPGAVTVIVGPNGAGKTSLLRALTGEQNPTRGEVLLNHQALPEWDSKQRARILGVLPQSSDLAFPFTAREVVSLGRIPHETGLQKDREIVAAALAAVDGSYLDKRFYTQMSGGEKQRVQMARVLAQIWEPPAESSAKQFRFLILDEPTASFDLAHQQLTLAVMKQFAGQGVGVLMVIHDLNLAAQCADQLVVLDRGEIVAHGAVEDVLTPAMLKQVFAVDASISTHPVTGKPLVIV